MNINDFKLKIENRFGDKITLSDDSVYVNNKTPIKLICKEHGEFSARPDNLMHACGCYKCGRESAKLKISDSPKTFMEKAIKKHGEGTYDYTIAITEYGKGKKVHIKCNKCGNIFEQSPYMHIAGNGCPFCHEFPKKDSTETFKEKLSKVHPNLELIGEYGKDNDDLITVRCKIHGEERKTTPHWIMSQKYGCEKCYREARHKKVVEECSKKFYEWLNKSTYIKSYDTSKIVFKGNKEKINLVCPIHGDFFLTPQKMMKRGTGCPFCKESHLERDTKAILKEHDIKFEPQKKFDWLKSKNKMSLDAFLTEYNIAIECQGEQHVDGRNNTFLTRNGKTFESLLERDLLKNKQCQEHGIRIIYIFKDKKKTKKKDEDIFQGIYKNALFLDEIAEDNSILLDEIKKPTDN